MRFSVVIPCHNAERWIEAALQSVANQTFAPHEIIVVDDASTDASLAVIEGVGFPVSLIRVNASNAAVARNSGIEAATGDWIAFLDADDIWYPNHLARAAELLRHGRDIAFMSNHDWIGLDQEVLPMREEYCCKLPAPSSEMSADDYYRIVEQGFHFGHSTVMYRRDRIFEAGLFDPAQKRRHDIDLWLRVIAGGTWTYDTVVSAGYRRHTPGSISRNELECDYYYIRAMVKNLDAVRTPLHRQHLSKHARRAMGIAFTASNPDHYGQLRALAWPHLPPLLKLFYKCADMAPQLARKVMETKRAIVMRKQRGVEHALSSEGSANN